MALSASLLGALTFTTAAGAKTVVATPTLGDMIVVIVAATGVASGLTVTDNNTDAHGAGKSYTQIVSSVKNTSADQMIAFVRADPIRKAVSTTWTTAGDAASSGGGLYVMRVTGSTFCGPQFIRQSGAQNNGAAAGTPTVSIGGAALTGNALITAVFNAAGAAPGITVPTSWAVADVNAGYITPSAGIEGTHINSGFTGSTVTWGSTSATAFCALAFEMTAATTGQTSIFPPRGGGAVDITLADSPKMWGVKRAAFF